MDIYEAIKERTSIRAFKKEDIDETKIERILEAARLAPSGKNGQPWTFIVVRNEETRKKLVPACKNQAFVGEAPVVIVACGHEEKAYQKMGGYWNSTPVDIGIALEHLMLAAAAEGLGTCWIGAFIEAEVKEILGIPDGVKIVALTPVGYPAAEKTRRPRKNLDEIVMYEKWERRGD
ncbi:MAG TPA: nitroreductase [Candidatus Eisenbacteria bacterium]|uniref:Nitroreductase n=1 Tax=Eiseniibacteriota bacterium TaxID=2212470 RepID=A0A7V2AUK9_UNCEI|nr:nitroreductase [Candidatus Eisenbacteria bacterium]